MPELQNKFHEPARSDPARGICYGETSIWLMTVPLVETERNQFIDVTFCSPDLMSSSNWRIDDVAIVTHSDHLAVRYSIDYNNSRQRVEEEAARLKPSPRRWKSLYFNDDVFREALCRE